MLSEQARVELRVADTERQRDVPGEALRVGSERAEVLRAARYERVEHRIDVGEPRVVARAGRSGARRGHGAVERRVDREIVREAEELREEVALPELERRRRRTEVAERCPVEEVRADGLVLD